jgi:hypothetical protein
MTNDNETPARSNKRVRIDPEPEIIRVENPKQAPTVAAAECVKNAVASHHDRIQSIATAISKTYNSLKSQLKSLAQTQARFTDDTFFPRSARIDFKLTSTKTVMENDEFKTISATVDAATLIYKNACKTAIVSVAKLAEEETKEKIRATLDTAIEQLSTMLLIEALPTHDSRPDKKCIWYVSDNLDATTSEAAFATKVTVKQKALRIALELPEDADTEGKFIQVSANDLATFKTINLKVKAILKAIFVDSWECQLTIYKQTDLDAALTKQAKEFQTVKATEATAMEIESQPTVEPKLMRELIRESVKEQLQKQTQQLSRNPKQQLAKNGKGGAKPSASLKKKNKQGEKPGNETKNPKAGSHPKKGKGASANAEKKKGKGASTEHSARASPKGSNNGKPTKRKQPQGKKSNLSKQK